MRNGHKLIILVILSILSVSNVFGLNGFENCENNLGIEKYSNLNEIIYDKVTSLGSKLVAKYSTSSETVRLENINKIFLLILNFKKISKLNEYQTQIIDLLGYHISCEMKKVGVSKVSNNTQTGTILNTKKVNEIWDYGFYVINENNDYDNDQKMEGCNEYGLVYPDTLCILKLGDMYVSPKSFTLRTRFILESKGITGEGTFTNLLISYKKDVDGVVNKDIFKNQDIYMNGLIGYGQKNVRTWGDMCASYPSYCSNYQIELSKVPNNSFDYDATTCDTLFNFRRNNGEYKALGNKQWSELTELGGDGLNNICSKDNSNTDGLCALQLNKSKLKIFTDGIYYGFKGGSGNMLGFNTGYYGGTISGTTPMNTASFLTFGSLERYIPKIISTSFNQISYDGIPKTVSIETGYKLVVEGKEIDELDFQTRCVGY